MPVISMASEDVAETVPAKFRLTFENVGLPAGETMGLLGGTFLYDVNDWLTLGPGAYGALTGKRGGFITLGVASELRFPVADFLELNGGVFVGGGGGRGGYTLQGGGLMIRPHVGVVVDGGAWGRFGAGGSYVHFPNGVIHSYQPYISYEYPFRALIGAGWPETSASALQSGEEVAASESEFSVVYRYYQVPANLRNEVGFLQRPLGLLGVEWLRYAADDLFIKIESEGALGGRSNGYMQIFLGGGYRFRLTGSTAVKLSAALGVAGGGRVTTGGGLLLDAGASLQQELIDGLYVEVGGGYVDAPDGTFRATSINGKIGYRFSSPDVQEASVARSRLAGFNQRNMRIRVAHQSYLKGDPRWRNHHVDTNVNLLGLQADYFLSEMFYLSGQGIAAYRGEAGGYMTGLVGGGLHLALGNTPLFAEADILGGAAGGGGLDVAGGLVWQCNAGIGYQFANPYSLTLGGGYMAAPKGNFKAKVVSLSLNYRFNIFVR